MHVKTRHKAFLQWFVCYCPQILFMLALLLTVFVYKDGLSGPFVFDDFINVVNNRSLRLSDMSWASIYHASTSIPNGIFGRPLSMLSFAADFFQDRNLVTPFPLPNTFKTTNLLIHLANGCVLYILTRLLVRVSSDSQKMPNRCNYAKCLALVVTTAWMLHPINLTGVLYVVQRMTSLATLFILMGTVSYVVGRIRLVGQQPGAYFIMVVAVALFTPLAFFCKEIGILLPAYIMLLEWSLFKRNEMDEGSEKFLHIYFAIFVWTPILVGMYYLAVHFEWFLNGYVRRDFNMTERLLTESRVIWFYLYQTVLPNIALLGLFHDDFILSRSLLEPVSTALALVGILGLLVALIALRKAQPLIAFGLAFFLVGHSLESTFIPLEIMHEHRNYLPSIGLLLAGFHVLLNPTIAIGTMVWRRISAIVLILLFSMITMSRVSDWSSAQTLWEAETTHHPDSIRSQIALGNYFGALLTLNPLDREGNYVRAMDAFERVLKLDKKNTIALFGILKLGKSYERPVDFHYVEELKSGLSQGSIFPDTNDRLIDLALCVGQAHCPVTADQYEGLLDAALSNPKLQGREKALIYSAQTFYFTRVAHDYAAHSSPQGIPLRWTLI